MQPAAGVCLSKSLDPLAGGGQQHPVSGLAAANCSPYRQMGFAGAGWAEEDHVFLAGDEVQGGEVGDQVAFQAAGVVEVELLNAFAGREAGGSDPVFAAVGISGGDLALQAGRQVFLMGPRFGAGPLGEPAPPTRAEWAL